MTAANVLLENSRKWVEENRYVVSRAYSFLLGNGGWPSVIELQRALDREGHTEINLQSIADSKPVPSSPIHFVHVEQLTLQVRHLMWLDDAIPLVALCIATIRMGIDRYFGTETDLKVDSSDLTKRFSSTRNSFLIPRVYDVLAREHPSPFGTSSNNSISWSFGVDQMHARDYRTVDSAESFVDSQCSVLERDVARTRALLANSPSLPNEKTSESKPLVFLSWSGLAGAAIAEAFETLLHAEMPQSNVFFSSNSIEPGEDPLKRMFDDSLLEAQALLVILTPDSVNSPWLIWETASAWARGQLLIPVFVAVTPGLVSGPLTTLRQGVDIFKRLPLQRAFDGVAKKLGFNSFVLSEEAHEELLSIVMVALAQDG